MLTSPLLHFIMLAPILVMGVRARRPRRAPKITLGPEETPTSGQLSALEREFVEDREPIHPSARGLVKYLDVIDGLTIQRCADAVLEWADPATRSRVAVMRQCRSFWCAWCIRRAHARRSRYQYAKLQSIQPQGEDALRIFNIVAELPQRLHPLVRHDKACLNAWVMATRKTFAQAFGFKGKKGRNATGVCWGSLAAIWNLHAIGDKGRPFPKYFPHWDILLSAYKLENGQIERLNSNWPEKFSKTRDKYRANIRDAFLPIATEGKHANAELAAFLRTEFDVIWHVSRPRKGSGDKYVHVRNAGHRVRYSCRPLFGLDRCKLEKNEHGNEILVYTPMPGGRDRIEHRVPPGPAFGALRDLKLQLEGKQARRLMGIIKDDAYKKALKISGRPEVIEQPKTGKKLVGAYARDEAGAWQYMEPLELRRV